MGGNYKSIRLDLGVVIDIHWKEWASKSGR